MFVCVSVGNHWHCSSNAVFFLYFIFFIYFEMGFLIGLELADVFCLAPVSSKDPANLHWRRLGFLECATTPGSFTWLLGIRLTSLHLQSKPLQSYLPTLRPLSLFFSLKFMTFSSSTIFSLGIPFSTSLFGKSNVCPFPFKKQGRLQKLPVTESEVMVWYAEKTGREVFRVEPRLWNLSSGLEWAFRFHVYSAENSQKGAKMLGKHWEGSEAEW